MNCVHALSCQLDHLVVTASTCAQGVDWLHDLSGVSLPAGGSHPLMATHNHLSALSDDQFLEVIAIDPNAPPPERPRWFLLDDDNHRRRLARSPVLTTWVAATSDLDAALDIARKAGIDPGYPVALTRGDLHWRLALMEDHSLCCDGVFPILIEWPVGLNPVSRMEDQGIRLQTLKLSHPQHAAINHAFDALGLSAIAQVAPGAAGLHAAMTAGSHRFELSQPT